MMFAAETATTLAAAVTERRMTAAGIAESCLAAIAAANPALNAFVDVDADAMRARARAVDARVASGARLPLAGVPLAVKDNLWVAGHRATQGSRLFRDFRPPAQAIVVTRLIAAGAVVAGMTNTPEFACKGVTNNPLFGPTRHPADPRLTPGGSSGGSSVAVAAGMVPLALGTDAGGSSRRPPAHVGVVGFKPSFGAVPGGPGFPDVVPGISVIAPIARCVADIAAAFEVMAGADPADPWTEAAAPDGTIDPRALRVAYAPRFGLERAVDDDVAGAIDRAVDRLAAAGIAIRRCDPVWPEGVSEATLMPLQHAGLAALHGAAFQADPTRFDPDIAVQIENGLRLPGAEVARATILSHQVAEALAAFWAEADLLIGPTVPCVAWPLDRLGPAEIGGRPAAPRDHAVFTPLFNHARVPAITIPCGSGRGGLPVGLQIVGPRRQDRRVLGFAAHAEAILAGR